MFSLTAIIAILITIVNIIVGIVTLVKIDPIFGAVAFAFASAVVLTISKFIEIVQFGANSGKFIVIDTVLL